MRDDLAFRCSGATCLVLKVRESSDPTAIHHVVHSRHIAWPSHPPTPSDLSDARWALIAPRLTAWRQARTDAGIGGRTATHLAVGLLAPTTGIVDVLGGRPGSSQAQLARVGFVAQDAPVYASLSVADHLKYGARLNPGWDAAYAKRRIERLGLNLGIRAGKLSGGQRAQLALTLAVAKQPELLILDEPAASLDPLARREFLQDLAEAVAEREMSVVLSSHLVSDLARTCDYLIVLSTARVQAAGPIKELLAAHRSLTGPRGAAVPADWQVVSANHGDARTTVVVRAENPLHDPAWTVSQVGLEDLVLAYLSQGRRTDTEPAK
ncbi:ATP-binding cassette domain-containing protein [Micromonospora sp. NPDC000668]|uniref:ATP-binding cassette domain-containing protein n=1 Tax=Micromonospora sp. NPDC000668 TaxID=3364219 RepID=UPI00369F13B6